MDMDLITLDMFLSLAGCIVVVGILTQACKYIPGVSKVPSLWVNFIISVIVGIIRLCVVNDFSAGGITIGILNIFVILVATSGTYEVVSRTVNSAKKNILKKGE